MGKRNLDGAMEEFSAAQQIHKTYVIVHNV